MLYAEKYGLNVQNSASDNEGEQDDDEEEEDSEDDRPLSMQISQQPASNRYSMQYRSPLISSKTVPVMTRGSLARPVSVRNIAELTYSSRRPAKFVKPATQQARNTAPIPADMHDVQRLYDHYNRKVYLEGYLFKKNDLAVDGKICGDRIWTRWYVELCGPVLTLWDASDDDETGELQQQQTEGMEQNQKDILPQYINITDSYVELLGNLTTEQPMRQHVFTLNTAGSNRYLLQATDEQNLVQWVSAIRLSCFECACIHSIYTRRFVSRTIFSELCIKQYPRVEGWVQARFPGSTEWQKYWTVVTDRRREKKLFGKKSVPARGQLMFYESKKAKHPVMTIVNVLFAYTIYPESPHLIDMATLMKVEGNMYRTKPNGEQELFKAAASTLIMTSNAKELVQWLVGTFDAFKLYGRPSKLLDDPASSSALNFGESKYGSDRPQLFLELDEVSHINFQESLLDNKVAFGGILENKLRAMGPQAPPPHGGMNNRTNSMPLLSGYATRDIHRRTYSTTQLQQYAPTPQVQPTASRSSTYLSSLASGAVQPARNSVLANRQSQQMSRKPIYASDESDEDEDSSEEDDDDDESSDDSIFNKNRKMMEPTSATTTATSTTTNTAPSAETSNSNKEQVPSPVGTTMPKTISSTPSTPLHPTSLSQLPPPPPPALNHPQPLTTTAEVRKGSIMTLPEISESNDFASSILGNITENEKHPEIPSRSRKTPANTHNENNKDSATSTPTIADSASNASRSSDEKVLKQRPTAEISSPRSAQAQASAPVTASAASSSRPPSSMGWKRRSQLGMTLQSSSSGSGSSNASRSSVLSVSQSESGSSVGKKRVVPHQQHQQRQSIIMMQQQQQQNYPAAAADERRRAMHSGQMEYMMSGYGSAGSSVYEHPQSETEDFVDGVPMPLVGENFITHNSLLDMYRPGQLPARVQEGYARSTGQPFVNLPTKQQQPRAGLVGMISQLEGERKERENIKGRLLEMEKERALDRERERFMADQAYHHHRQQYEQQQQQPSASSPQVCIAAAWFWYLPPNSLLVDDDGQSQPVSNDGNEHAIYGSAHEHDGTRDGP